MADIKNGPLFILDRATSKMVDVTEIVNSEIERLRELAYVDTSDGQKLWKDACQGQFDINEQNRNSVKEARYLKEVLQEARDWIYRDEAPDFCRDWPTLEHVRGGEAKELLERLDHALKFPLRDAEIDRLRIERDQFKHHYECALADNVRLNNEKCDANWPDSNLLIVHETAKARKAAIEECTAKAKDYALDAQPDSGYALACNDLVEAFDAIRALAEDKP